MKINCTPDELEYTIRMLMDVLQKNHRRIVE